MTLTNTVTVEPRPLLTGAHGRTDVGIADLRRSAIQACHLERRRHAQQLAEMADDGIRCSCGHSRDPPTLVQRTTAKAQHLRVDFARSRRPVFADDDFIVIEKHCDHVGLFGMPIVAAFF